MTDSQAMLKARGTSTPIPVLDDIQNALAASARLRQALNTLQAEMPVEWQTDNVNEVLEMLRENLEALELEEIRRAGPREYVMIKPLAPDAGGEFAEQTAGHVRALDDLGLIVRIGLL